MSNQADRDDVAAATAAALLGAGSTVNAWSLMLGLAASWALLSAAVSWSSGCFAASVVAGLVQAYFALRCSIDAALFRRLGGQLDHYERLDTLLSAWGLVRSHQPGTHQPRPLHDRIQAALALSRRQRTCFYLQLAMFVVGAAVGLTAR